MPHAEPLHLKPILKEKVWGGRRLETYGKLLAPGAMVGESWELADLASTSPSGGGGESAHSAILGGSWDGCTLADAVRELGTDLLGGAALVSGGFPLLVKFLDAREHLSVQVHPSPEFAQANPGAALKAECWFVLDAEPGAVIYKGLAPGVDGRRLAEAIEAGTVPEVLNAIPAVSGEMHDLPSGTVHALGAGVLVCEVQTPSDTTYRVYDWAKEYGREGRALHVSEALACTLEDAPPAPTAAPDELGLHPLVSNAFYEVSLARGSVMLRGMSPVAVVATGGAVRGAGLDLARGSTALIPACIADGFELTASSGAVVARLPSR
ncbi:MAG: type I phosphomannose isomerase catalytic subunit [Planctomycetota bacterium]